jgi:hypothetical protein
MGSNGDRMGVFCLEGRWGVSPFHSGSLTGALSVLEGADAIKFERHRVTRAGRLRHWAREWSARPSFEFGYFATHGERGCLKPGWVGLSLDRLGEELEGCCENRLLFFASCLTAGRPTAIHRFMDRTGAKAVLGYTRSVQMVEAAALEMIVLNTFAEYMDPARSAGRALEMVCKRHSELAAHLGFIGWWRDSSGRLWEVRPGNGNGKGAPARVRQVRRVRSAQRRPT